MNKFSKQQIIQFTYDRQIIEEDGNIHGFVKFNGKPKYKIWLKVSENQYTDDNDYYDTWISEKHNITVDELKTMRLKDKEKIQGYLKQKKKKTKKKTELLIDKK